MAERDQGAGSTHVLPGVLPALLASPRSKISHSKSLNHPVIMQDVLGVQQACPRVLSGGHACFSGRPFPDPSCIQLLGRRRSSLPVRCTGERQQIHQKPSHRRAGRAQAASFTMWQPDSGAGSGDDAGSGQRATTPRSGKSWRLGAAQNDGRLSRPLRINLDLKLVSKQALGVGCRASM